MLRVYEQLLRLYPARFRREFTDEMTGVLEDVLKDGAGESFTIRLGLYVREGFGLLFGALCEHRRQFDSWRFSMRGEFRFPKATWILMTLILAGVVSAIEKGEAISESLSPSSTIVTPYAGPHTLVVGIAVLFAAMYVVGLIAWGIRLLLRRDSGETFGRQIGSSR